jgi:hypothetical protein
LEDFLGFLDTRSAKGLVVALILRGETAVTGFAK